MPKVKVKSHTRGRSKAPEWTEVNILNDPNKVECKHCLELISNRIARIQAQLGKCKRNWVNQERIQGMDARTPELQQSSTEGDHTLKEDITKDSESDSQVSNINLGSSDHGNEYIDSIHSLKEKSQCLDSDFIELMKNLHACPASSGSLERFFSTYGLVWSKIRNKLGKDKAEKLVRAYRYLKKN